MADVLAKAVRDRRRPLRDDCSGRLRRRRCCGSRAERTQRIVGDARRRARTHNGGRKFVETGLFDALAASCPLRGRARRGRATGSATTPPCARRSSACGRCSPRPSSCTTCSGRSRCCGWPPAPASTDAEIEALHRPRATSLADVAFTNDDVPLLDEARALLGARSRAGATVVQRQRRDGDGDDEVRTYGHIIVDEAQDLSPMQLRMLGRRSLNGSMTIVGDIAQATGAWAHGRLGRDPRAPAHRAPGPAPGRAHHRLPHPGAQHGAGRQGARRGRPRPAAAPVGPRATATRPASCGPRRPPSSPAPRPTATVAERDAVGTGNIAVICPASLVEPLAAALERRRPRVRHRPPLRPRPAGHASCPSAW